MVGLALDRKAEQFTEIKYGEQSKSLINLILP